MPSVVESWLIACPARLLQDFHNDGTIRGRIACGSVIPLDAGNPHSARLLCESATGHCTNSGHGPVNSPHSIE
ncbi:MAG TPA: hypothetical protein VFO39_12185, partial [Candidatus Sulfotelmatobacter sp.]|nr:hypothetical protein [Candidatus Sulfotelmatobacter sp.]